MLKLQVYIVVFCTIARIDRGGSAGARPLDMLCVVLRVHGWMVGSSHGSGIDGSEGGMGDAKKRLSGHPGIKYEDSRAMPGTGAECVCVGDGGEAVGGMMVIVNLSSGWKRGRGSASNGRSRSAPVGSFPLLAS